MTAWGKWRPTSKKHSARNARARAHAKAADDYAAKELQRASAYLSDPTTQAIIRAQREAVGNIFREDGKTHLAVLKAAVNAASFSDTLVSKAHDRLPPDRHVACMEGCHWCCYLTVQVSAPELFFIAEWVRQTHSAEQLQQLR